MNAPIKSVMITCATTGSGLTPSMSPYLPYKPEDIARESIEAAEAGAAIIHLHARDPRDGRPTNDVGVWKDIIDPIREKTDAIINMSASMGSTAENRTEASLAMRPDVATIVVGSMNYGSFKKAIDQGVENFKYDWEREKFGPDSYNLVTANTYAKIDRMIDIFTDADIAIEFECYDIGHIYILDYHLNRKPNLKRPIIVQFLTGILGGIPSGVEHLLHMKQTAERLFGKDMILFIHGTGPQNMRAATYGALMGTNIRIGQEDNLLEREGVLFKSNAEQVQKIVRILGEFDIKPTSIADARTILDLPKK
ncbi:beta-keto acid cleavage family enzyme [Chelatococcus asaccharovorans]|uniref:3-keto-5-aminohexanoate cleavage protein n=1 Tax=Chelatococcus asaccharovorans TaxID=28210 RepID=UPI00224C6B8C|nr:3-keto-5-aminohexanoate cleavage protein [Chelatococcus asaccharovorans]CAH1649666.1 putative 3-keto-5-aminohexanoate cleavage enzyme [Chelatococcus asaccharovorans]CAH1691737.1 putative 3-keto-5-aminohexanoate cleavage enzyme [Chelatococcus asaccharovorans]